MSNIKERSPQIVEIITKIKNYRWVIRMQLYKRKADRLSKKTGSQYFILMFQGKVSIVSKEWFKEKRQEGMFPRKFTADNLKKISFYHTKA